MFEITHVKDIKAYYTNSKEESCVEFVKPSVVYDIALALLKENGMVPFFYGLTKDQVILGTPTRTYVVSPAFVGSVKKLAEKSGIAVSLKDPCSLGIYIQGSRNTAGIILVKNSRLSKL